jgi:hypothetical protein
VARNGAILLIVTPIQDAVPGHMGCRVFEVTDIESAQVRRDANGEAALLMRIDGDPGAFGSGQCTYDADSETGVIIDMYDASFVPATDISFSPRATGLHPLGIDTDADDVADSVDNCPAWPNASQALPNWPIPAGADADCDGFRDSTSATNVAPETYIGTDPDQHCAATAGANNDLLPDAWPVDFNDDRIVNGQDTGKYGGPFGSYNKNVSQGPFGPPGGEIPGERFDFSGNGLINGQDIGRFQNFFGKTCTLTG